MRYALVALSTCLLLISGCTGSSSDEEVVVGVGATVEQRVLAAITAEALQRADIAVETEQSEGQTVALRRLARAGTIDLFWDYTGAAWALGLGEEVPHADPVESYERIRNADERTGLDWLSPTSANATLALFVRSEDLPAPEEDRSMTWLAGTLSSGQARLCADPEFLQSPVGLSALAVEYAINLDQVAQRPATEEQAIAAVAAGECFAGLATATSGRAALEGLVPVADVQSVFPAFVVAPVVHLSDAALRERVEAALAPVTSALDTATLARLNAEVVAGRDPAVVADSFLDEVSSTNEATETSAWRL
jgi:osmoprotectant transport system substrate-binding protein